MRRNARGLRNAAAIVSAFLAACSPATTTTTQLMNIAKKAQASAFEETVFGVKISDPYRWMEDPARSKDMTAWVREATAEGMAQIAQLPGRRKMRDALLAASRAGVVYRDLREAGGRLFVLRLDPDASVPKLVVRESGGTERVLFDPAATGGTEPVAIDSFMPSPTGRLLAIHTAAGGGEVGPIRFMDVATGAWRDDVINPVWGEFYVGWIDEDSALFTRLD